MRFRSHRRKRSSLHPCWPRKAIECFLPLYPKRSIWSDRIKVTTFLSLSGTSSLGLTCVSAYRFLLRRMSMLLSETGKFPAAIPERDLDAIRAALRNGFTVEPYDCLLEGDIVRVTKGPLTGVEGSSYSTGAVAG